MACEDESKLESNSPILEAFRTFQHELDDRHDKYERLVKLSRDITIDSKRAIFQLQRIPGSSSEVCERILNQTREKLNEVINNKFFVIAEETCDEDAYQYIRAYTPGLQEFIEAESLYHYLRDGTLVSHLGIQRSLEFSPLNADPARSPRRICVTVPAVDYILGIADLTGEVMRLAITYVSTGDLDRPFQLCKFLRRIHDAFASFGFVSRDFSRKLHVSQQSLVKVETACYNLHVRGSEVPKHMLVDMFHTQNIAEDLDEG